MFTVSAWAQSLRIISRIIVSQARLIGVACETGRTITLSRPVIADLTTIADNFVRSLSSRIYPAVGQQIYVGVDIMIGAYDASPMSSFFFVYYKLSSELFHAIIMLQCSIDGNYVISLLK